MLWDDRRSFADLQDVRRPPEFQERHHHQQREERRDDVDQGVVHEVRPVKLHRRERQPAYRQRGPDLERLFPIDHAPHQPQRQDQRERRQDSPGHRAQRHFVQSGHAREHAQRIAHAAPGHRRRVGDQTQRRRLKRREPQPDQKRSRNGHRRASAARAFQKGPETERDQNQLQSLVGRERGDRILHHLKLPLLYRDVVEEHRSDDDPCYPQYPEDHSVRGGGADHLRRHPENDERQNHRRQHPAHRRKPDPLPERDQNEEERQYRQGRNQRRKRPGTQWVVILRPGVQM